MAKIRLGVGNSRLAKAQGDFVSRKIDSEVIVLAPSVGAAEGYFSVSGELFQALRSEEIDAAVFDMKHLPLDLPDGIVVSAVLRRDPPFDFLVVDKELDGVYTIGTTSLRRGAQLLRYYHKYPEMHVSPISGDIDSRLEQLHNGDYDAIIVDESALKHLGYMGIGFRLPADAFVPSPNQGAIAILSLENRKELFTSLNDSETAFDTSVERAILKELGGGNLTPIGVYAQGGRVLAEVLSLDGGKAVRVESEVPCIEAAHAIGKALKEKAAFLIENTSEK